MHPHPSSFPITATSRTGRAWSRLLVGLAVALPLVVEAAPATTDSSVVITNTPQAAVPVRDVSWQPVRLFGLANLPLSGFHETLPINFTVPAGSRMVIDQVSLECSMNGTESLSTSLRIKPAGANTLNAVHFPAISFLGNGHSVGGFTTQVSLLEGETLTAFVERGAGTSTGTCVANILGRLYKS